MDDIKARLSREAREIQRSVRERTLTFISAGFGLVVGLAWNDAISNFIKLIFPQDANGVIAKFVYALVLTVFVTLVIVYLERAMKRSEMKEDQGST